MSTSLMNTETQPDNEALEAFVRFGLRYYCRGVLMRPDKSTPEWQALARHVLGELDNDSKGRILE